LLKADRDDAAKDAIYRMGVIGQFNLTFELAWKSVKEALEFHGVALTAPGSPREILKEGYAADLVNDEEVWLDMLKKRNLAIHIYDEAEADKLVSSIFEKYIAVFVKLRDVLAGIAAAEK